MVDLTLSIYCACISTSRPKNVPEMIKRTGVHFTYYTKIGERKAYTDAGAKNVVEVSGNICVARNRAIKDANGMICLQVSDDYRKTNLIRGKKGEYTRKEIPFKKAVTLMASHLKSLSGTYAGTSTTDSLIQYNGKQVEANKLIVNDCILLDGAFLFDEKADLKEDYDMFVRQVREGGKVLRFNLLQMTFPHRSNAGGANDYRTSERERECNLYVMRKHQGILVNHAKRENQIKVDYKRLIKR